MRQSWFEPPSSGGGRQSWRRRGCATRNGTAWERVCGRGDRTNIGVRARRSMFAGAVHAVPPPKKLVFLYVANEIIQRHRKQQPELVRELARVLPDAIEHIMR